MTTPSARSPRAEFLGGARDQLPLLLGVIPFGLIFGALAIEAGVPPLGANGLSLFVFAGSAQFVSLNLVETGAPALVMILTIFIVNLRHALYSASLAPHVRHLPARWRLLLAYLLTDEAFAVAQARYRRPPLETAHWYALGTGLALWTSWQLSTLAGVFFGARVPASWSLDFALPLTFLALLLPALVDRPAWVAALGGAALAILLHGLPYNLGLVVAAMTAVGIALATEGRQESLAANSSAAKEKT
ncbi:MAG TPA: AzlC family ABC transporter permease [Anaerolineales bacterium]|nr:AzlC family ABC transporter permease [Anaerolineales bacterium]